VPCGVPAVRLSDGSGYPACATAATQSIARSTVARLRRVRVPGGADERVLDVGEEGVLVADPQEELGQRRVCRHGRDRVEARPVARPVRWRAEHRIGPGDATEPRGGGPQPRRREHAAAGEEPQDDAVGVDDVEGPGPLHDGGEVVRGLREVQVGVEPVVEGDPDQPVCRSQGSVAEEDLGVARARSVVLRHRTPVDEDHGRAATRRRARGDVDVEKVLPDPVGGFHVVEERQTVRGGHVAHRTRTAGVVPSATATGTDGRCGGQ
jgi:hypothetical protein